MGQAVKINIAGLEVMKKNLENIGEYKNLIYGMHLNYSLSGEYVNKAIKENREKSGRMRFNLCF